MSTRSGSRLLNSSPVLPTTTPVPKPPPWVGVTLITLPNWSATEKLVVPPTSASSSNCGPRGAAIDADALAPAGWPASG